MGKRVKYKIISNMPEDLNEYSKLFKLKTGKSFAQQAKAALRLYFKLPENKEMFKTEKESDDELI